MKKILYLLFFLPIFLGCSTHTDYMIPRVTIGSLGLVEKTASGEETVSGNALAIPAAYKYISIGTNVSFGYEISKDIAENVDRYIYIFKIIGPRDFSAYMLYTEEITDETKNWVLWDVLNNLSYPTFLINEIKGGEEKSADVKNFLAGKAKTHSGFIGEATKGNSYEAKKLPNGNLKDDVKLYFGADRYGRYKATMEVMDISNGAVLASVSKIITVR